MREMEMEFFLSFYPSDVLNRIMTTFKIDYWCKDKFIIAQEALLLNWLLAKVLFIRMDNSLDIKEIKWQQIAEWQQFIVH